MSAAAAPAPTVSATTRSTPGRWMGRAAYAAAIWSLGYAAVAIYWTATGEGFPFGENDPQAFMSVLGSARVEIIGPLFAALGVIGGLVALALAGGRGSRSRVGPLLLGFAWVLAFTLMLVIPDSRLLAGAGYFFVVMVGAPFGAASVSEYIAAYNWSVVNQIVSLVGGFLWAATAIAYRRRMRPVSHWIPGGDHVPPQRWERWAVFVAIAVPLIYAVPRYAWALGVPMGVTDDFLRDGQATASGAGLATAGVIGAILTWGLIRPWGEVLPRWMPLIGGRRVPPAVATVPASVVAVLVFVGGRTLLLMPPGLEGTDLLGRGLVQEWATLGPTLLWPVWGVALGLAALGYHRRRVGRSVAVRDGAQPGMTKPLS
ncbi:hypothetical protein BH23ACT8_BH23ACT8_11570 [soil metagenome]